MCSSQDLVQGLESRVVDPRQINAADFSAERGAAGNYGKGCSSSHDQLLL